MRILHVLNHSVPHMDGYCVRTLNILRSQRNVGLEVVGVTSPHHEPPTNHAVEEVEGFQFHRCAADRLIGRPVAHEVQAISRFSARIRRVAQEVAPQIIHAHSPATWGIAARRAAHKLKLPFVYEVRGIWEDAAVDQGKLTIASVKYRVSRWLETWVAQRAAALVCISQGLIEEFASRGVPRDKMWLAPNGVNLEEFKESVSPASLRTKLGLQDAPVVAYIGSMYAWEGVDDLIVCFKKVLEEVDQAVLLVIGSGPELPALTSMANVMNLGDRVRVLGRVPFAEISEYYALADLLVYPRKSTKNVETVTPLKPLEAMAQARPVLGSNIGGIRELFPSEPACFFRAGDRDDLARSIVGLLKNPSECERIGKAVRAHVVEHRQWQHVAKIYPELYSVLVKTSHELKRAK